jgi:N-acetylglucosaminyl-diphospho-decaprenol L-rhamnosyltransferase
MHDLAIIIVSTNEAKWLRPCLSTVFERAGSIELDVVVADNESTDGTRELVEQEFPRARVVTCPNRGFSHANNRGLMTCDARYVLFLNPDTEVVDGTFEQLVAALDRRPELGLVGVRQVTADGELFPTIRRAPNALRALGEALGSERFPVRAPWLGERELDLDRYDEEVPCDWTSGSFLLARREALESAGFLDERFFIYAEETDLCRRIKQAGWEIVHLPLMTIVHHADKAGINPRMEAQAVFARLQYARKNFSPLHRQAYVAALLARHLLRAGFVGRDREFSRQRRAGSRRALRTLLGAEQPPFGLPPGQAVALRHASTSQTASPAAATTSNSGRTAVEPAREAG